MSIILDDIHTAVRIHFISLVEWIESEIHNECRQGALVLYKECLPLEIEYIKKYADMVLNIILMTKVICV